MKKFILIISVLALALGLFAADVKIGTGTETQRFPLGSYYGYERSAALYTASEMGAQSTPIINIGWMPSISTSVNVPTKIYLKSTTASTLSNSYWADMISGATLVYNQNQSYLSAGAWNILELADSFQVNSGENLIILVERNYGLEGSGGAAGSGIRSSSIANKHLTWQSDNFAPTGFGNTTAIRPNVILSFDSTITSFPFVEGFEAGNTDQLQAISDWTQATGPIYTNKYWTANSSQTDNNRAPRTGSWNATLAQSGRSTLIRPIQLTGGMHYSIEFYARQNSTTNSEITIGAKYGSQASLAGMTETIIPATGLTNGNYQRFYGVLSPTTSGRYYIGIQGSISLMQNYISLDDITINVLNITPHELPFVEGWDSGDFQTHRWTRDTTDWEIYNGSGNPVPTALFTGFNAGLNYSSSLRSFDLDATEIGDLQLSFGVSFQQVTGVTSESKMTWQIWNGSAWITLGSYSSLDGTGNILHWTDYSYNISAYAAHRVFKIRFVASGENASHLVSWMIDNISVVELTYNTLPFTEDWNSEAFATNGWTTDTTAWIVSANDGDPAPAARFRFIPRQTNYSRPLTSKECDARGKNSVHFSFDLYLSTDTSPLENKMTWQIFNGSTWITLGSYSSLSGDLNWTHKSYDVSAHASNRIFKIRFVASGADNNHINGWNIDNIKLNEANEGVTGINIARTGTSIVLNWTAVPGAAWYKVYTSTSPNGSYTLQATETTTTATIGLSSLPGNKHFFKVTAGS